MPWGIGPRLGLVRGVGGRDVQSTVCNVLALHREDNTHNDRSHYHPNVMSELMILRVPLWHPQD